jgi:hypothetical protein
MSRHCHSFYAWHLFDKNFLNNLYRANGPGVSVCQIHNIKMKDWTCYLGTTVAVISGILSEAIRHNDMHHTLKKGGR